MPACSQYVFHLLFALALYVGVVDVALTGYGKLIVDLAKKCETPGAPDVSMANYTGHRFLDHVHNIAVVVFWYMGQGPLSALLLRWIAMVGAGAASLLLLMLEAGRTESLSRMIVKMLLLTFVGQAVGIATVIPLLCSWDLRSHSELSARRDSLPESLKIVRNVKHCVLGIYLVCNSILFLPTPSAVSHTSKHLLLVLYQYWGVYASAALALACFLQKDRVAAAARQPLPAIIASNLRSSYPIAFACAAIPYCGVVLTSLATTWLPFGVFSGYKGEITVERTLLPQPLWSFPREATLSSGMGRILSWDFPISGAAILTWAIVRYTRACEVEKLPVDFSRLLLQALGLSIVVGPHGTAALLFWKRNEIVERALKREKGK